MKIKDSITQQEKQNLKKFKKKKKQEKVDWVDIMGMNRDIYTRKNGAVRRK